MNLPIDYVPGSDSMYLHIFAPTLQAAIAGMKNAMNQLDWAKNYVAYVVGEETEKQVNGCSVKHFICPAQSTIGGWILEIPNVIAQRVCLPMQQWFADNPHQLQNVDLLTREQAANIEAYPELRGLKK